MIAATVVGHASDDEDGFRRHRLGHVDTRDRGGDVGHLTNAAAVELLAGIRGDGEARVLEVHLALGGRDDDLLDIAAFVLGGVVRVVLGGSCRQGGTGQKGQDNGGNCPRTQQAGDSS